MDIEGFVRARIDDYDYDDLAEISAVRIKEYKKISQENSVEILSETYNQDFDEIAYEPEVIQGDNDEEAANMFGY